MARAKLSPLLEHLRGAIGGMVFRNYGGRTVVSARPRPSSKPPSEAQLLQRRAFADGVAYANEALKDPETKAFYVRAAQAAGGNHFARAVSDYLTPPEITRVVVEGLGEPGGGTIVTSASGDGTVVRIDVEILDTAGAVLERGAAERIDGAWRYRPEIEPPAGQPTTVRVSAIDRPGNRTVVDVAG